MPYNEVATSARLLVQKLVISDRNLIATEVRFARSWVIPRPSKRCEVWADVETANHLLFQGGQK